MMETSGFRREVAAFLEEKQSRVAEARQMAALQIACHFDLEHAMSADPDARRRIVLRLERTIERERQRGIRRHWSYDLNRHIALKQALDKLRATDGDIEQRPAGSSNKQTGLLIRTKRRPKAPLKITA
jgi:hypothetical protein